MNDEALDTLLGGAGSGPPAGPHVDDADLVAYQRGRLPEALAAEVEVHLGGCAGCRALLAELAEPVPEVMRARARRALEARSPTREARPGGLCAAPLGGASPSAQGRPVSCKRLGGAEPSRATDEGRSRRGGLADRGRARSMRSKELAALGGLAAAAAVVLSVSGPAGGPDLPEYTELEVRGGRQDHRGAPATADATARFGPESRLELVLRPASPVEGAAPHLIAYLEPASGSARRVELPAARSAEGAFRVRGRAAELLGAAPGPYRLHLIVSRAAAWPARLPDAAAIAERAGADPHLVTSLELVADEEPSP